MSRNTGVIAQGVALTHSLFVKAAERGSGTWLPVHFCGPTRSALMSNEQDLTEAVMSRITANDTKSLMVELARIPSPLTPLMEAEPCLSSGSN